MSERKAPCARAGCDTVPGSKAQRRFGALYCSRACALTPCDHHWSEADSNGYNYCERPGCSARQWSDPHPKVDPEEDKYTCAEDGCGAQLYDFCPEHCTDDTPMKGGKLQLELIDLAFLADMAKHLQGGLVPPRVADGWRKLDPEVWVRKYRGALMRHLVATQDSVGAVDSQTGATHWAGVAVNAMICGVLERLQQEKSK